MSDEVARRIAYNREENERYFNAITSSLTIPEKIAFQNILLDGMFSVIEAVDFQTICLKIARDMHIKGRVQ
jgi:hypothetical protein